MRNGVVVFAIAVGLAGCGGGKKLDSLTPETQSPTIALSGDYSQLASCVIRQIPEVDIDKPMLTEDRAEGRSVIIANLTAGAFRNYIQIFEASFKKQGERDTVLTVKESTSVLRAPDYWQKIIAAIADSCSQQQVAPPAPKRNSKPRQTR
ncbi:hypothetical protein [Tardiphaga sp.]|uniref:hypothetical protein n=1 Tax=Tardiphaga sp. TaxID=1926292 RepID=UPI00260CCD80|nr:hypothetical protein [Tardiphaga sp.]MDB5618478.1 hypothetical protein [Tardiphaga sp.]